MEKWKVYIVSHKKIIDDYLRCDKSFCSSNYEILNVGDSERIVRGIDISEVNQKKFDTFISLGKWWAESEGIYNIWRSGKHRELDYIGFIHYDLELKLRDGIHLKRTNITQRINNVLSKSYGDVHISFETHGTEAVYNQRVLADKTQPNRLSGEGINCIDYIIQEYNSFFGTNYNLQDFIKKRKVNLCSCFLIDTKHFDEMMLFFDWIVKKGDLLMFDTEHKNRIQGGLAERFFGVYLAFTYDNMYDMSLVHNWNKGLK